MKNFRTYQLSIQFYRATSKAPVPGHLRNQLLRAASSVTLNLGEGYGRIQKGDQRRFFEIATLEMRREPSRMPSLLCAVCWNSTRARRHHRSLGSKPLETHSREMSPNWPGNRQRNRRQRPKSETDSETAGLQTDHRILKPDDSNGRRTRDSSGAPQAQKGKKTWNSDQPFLSCSSDEGRPLDFALQGEKSNHHKRLRVATHWS